MTPTNRTMPIILIIIIATALFMPGCTVRTADLTLVSTKNIDYTDMNVNMKQGKRYKGEDCTYTLLGIPLGQVMPNLKTAVDDALQQGGGNIMLDEVTYVKGAWYILGTMSCYDVEGTVLNAKEEHASP